MSIRTMKCLVAMQERLHIVFPGLQVAQIPHRIAKCGGIVHDNLFARLQLVHIHAEYNLRLVRNTDLIAGLCGRISGEEQQDAPIKRYRAAFLCERNRKLRMPGNHRRCHKKQPQNNQDKLGSVQNRTRHEILSNLELRNEAHESYCELCDSVSEYFRSSNVEGC